jgi:transcriptional regulator with XRE-family HTH domain
MLLISCGRIYLSSVLWRFVENILQIIGRNIGRRRKQLGLSQEALADKSQLHRTYVGGVERGERNISAKNIAKIAKALSIQPSDLLKP